MLGLCAGKRLLNKYLGLYRSRSFITKEKREGVAVQGFDEDPLRILSYDKSLLKKGEKV